MWSLKRLRGHLPEYQLRSEVGSTDAQEALPLPISARTSYIISVIASLNFWSFFQHCISTVYVHVCTCIYITREFLLTHSYTISATEFTG